MAQKPVVMRRARFRSVGLKPDEQRKWDETLAACNWVAPGFTHVMYSMLVPRGRTMAALFTEDMQYMAATDGYQLIFKPSRYFAENTLMQRVFIMCHEIMHNIWDHCGMGERFRIIGSVTWEGVTVPYFHPFANWVQDLIINDALFESRLGEFKPGWLRQPALASHKDSWVERYVKLYRECQQEAKGKGKGKGQGGKGKDEDVEDKLDDLMGGSESDDGQGDEDGKGGPAQPRQGQFDLHCAPASGGENGEEEDDQPQERSQIEWQQAVAAGMAVAKAQGKLPSTMELLFGQILEPTVHWAEHIRALLARKVGTGGYDWRRPDRRLIVRGIGAPGRTGHGAHLVIVGGDNSGSIYSDPSLLGRWLGEIGGILSDINPETIILIWCDAIVHEVDEITSPDDLVFVQKRGTTGGGGTSFVPVFEWIAEHNLKPDALVYLTDMMGTFPKEAPDYPVIWGQITPLDQYKAPFGDAVFIPTHS